MKLKEIIHEDYANYKKPSLFLGTCFCDWKCCKEDSACKCQNAAFVDYPIVDVSNESIVAGYLANELTHAVVIGGLEPMMQFDELVKFVDTFRKSSQDDIVIYTGYYKHELLTHIGALAKYPNIIIKFGRYKSGDFPHHDEILGVDLANKEQFAEKIS